MQNRFLRKDADSVSGIVERLIEEIEMLEYDRDEWKQKAEQFEDSLSKAQEEIEELKSEIDNQ